MAANVSPRKLIYVKPLQVSRVFDVLRIPVPQPCTILSASLLIGSFAIIGLMLLGILPLSLLLGFLAFAMMAAGGTLAMIFCGEI